MMKELRRVIIPNRTLGKARWQAWSRVSSHRGSWIVFRRAGLPYRAAFWLVVDEGLVPLLGLSKEPGAYSLSTHIYALASHLVFGATAEGVRRVLRG